MFSFWSPLTACASFPLACCKKARRELRGKAIDRCASTEVQMDYCIQMVHRLSLAAYNIVIGLSWTKEDADGNHPQQKPLEGFTVNTYQPYSPVGLIT